VSQEDRLCRMHRETESRHPSFKTAKEYIGRSTLPKKVHDILIAQLKDNPLAKDADVNYIMATPGDFTEASVRFWADLYAAHDNLSVVEPVTPLPGDVPGGDPGDSVSDAGSDIDDAPPTGPIPPPSAAIPGSSSSPTVFPPPPPRSAPYGSPISSLISHYFLFHSMDRTQCCVARVGIAAGRVHRLRHKDPPNDARHEVVRTSLSAGNVYSHKGYLDISIRSIVVASVMAAAATVAVGRVRQLGRKGRRSRRTRPSAVAP
jgi:hypothetical protein